MKRKSALIIASLIAVIALCVPALTQDRVLPGAISGRDITNATPLADRLIRNGLMDPPEYRCSWVYGFASEFANPTATSTMINRLADNNFNVVIPEIRKAGDAYYNSAYEPWATDVQPGYDPLADMISKAHAKGMEVWGWIVTFRIWTTSTSKKPPATHIWAKHPEWVMVNSSGGTKVGSYYDLDPGVPGVQQYIADLMKDCIQKYPDLDGYNFDYIRYEAYNWGYNPISKERFRSEYGYYPPTSTSDPNWGTWCEWRRRQITSVVKKCYLEAIYLNPSIKISCDTIGWMGGDPSTDFTTTRAYSEVCQDHYGWMMDGIIDVNILMNYKRDWTGLLAPTYRYKGYSFGNQQADHRRWADYLTLAQALSGRHAVDGLGSYLNIMPGILDQWGYSRTQYSFEPVGKTYDSVADDLYNEDYTATLLAGTTGTTTPPAPAPSGGTASKGSDEPRAAAAVEQSPAPGGGTTVDKDAFDADVAAAQARYDNFAQGLSSEALTAPKLGMFGAAGFPAGEDLAVRRGASARLRLPAQSVDMGDYYVGPGGKRVGLYRVPDEVSVKYASSVGSAQGALRSVPGLASADRVGQVTYRAKGLIDVLRTATDASGRLARSIAGQQSVAYSYPVLMDPATQSRLLLTDEVLARFPDAVSTSAQYAAISRAGLEMIRQTGSKKMNVYLLRVRDPKGDSPLDAANRLAESGQVLWAQPNFVHEGRLMYTPSDPLYAAQQNMHNTGQNGAWNDADVDAPEAWDVRRGSTSITIAIIDTGIDTSHTDLNIAPGGYDFANGDTDPNPIGDDYHGTACAGVAAAIINNSTRIAGIAGQCKILPIKIFDDSTNWVSDQAAGDAISYAADHADILSNSWGIGGPSSYINDAVQYANTQGRGGKGCPVFFSTGDYASKWDNGGARVVLPLTGVTGSYYFGFRFYRGSASADENAIMIDDICLLSSDGYTHSQSILTNQNFESSTFPPAGWSTINTFGSSSWSRVVTSSKRGNRGLYSAHSPSLSSGQSSIDLVTPLMTVSGNEYLAFSMYKAAASDSYLCIDVYDENRRYLGILAIYACDSPYVNTSITYPATLSTVYSGTCAVGASTDGDRRADYSAYGPELTLVAPSSGGWNDIVTLDPTGSVGRDDSDYTTFFGGTSAATSMAAGIAALILSGNPDLTALQVRAVMQASCDKIGSDSYTDGWNQYCGYGRINAATAVAMPPPVMISGYVRTAGGQAIAGVAIAAAPGVQSTVTDAEGYYQIVAPSGWIGTVTPSKTGYVFDPTSASYDNVVSNQTNQNFTATKVTCVISGHVLAADGSPVSYVKMYGLPGDPWTDANGYYTATVPVGWSGSVTPTRWHNNGLGTYRYGFDVGLEDTANPGLPVLSGSTVVQGSEDLFYNTVKSTLFQNPAPIPDMPWKSSPTTGYLFGQVTDALEPNDYTYQNWIYKATVTATGPAGPDSRVWTTETDATGTYGFMKLPPGDYTVTFTHPGHSSQEDVPASVTAGLATRLDQQLGPIIPEENYKSLGDCADPTLTPDGTVVSITDTVVVTAPSGAISGCVYVETADRSSGLRVQLGVTQPTVAEGDRVRLIGIVSTTNGERVLTHGAVMSKSSGTALTALGSAIGDMSKTPVSTGLLQRICGRVTSSSVGYFQVSDGSGTIKVSCPGLVAPAQGMVVQVTGVNSKDPTERVLRTRRQSDISVVSKSTISSPAGTVGIGMNLVSLPYVPTDPTPSAVLSGMTLHSKLYRWSNATQAFVPYDQTQPSVFGSLSPSGGYALFSTASRTLSFEALPNPTVDMRIPLPARGWSLIGYPLLSPVLWESCFVTDGFQTLTLDDAVTAGWLGRIAFTWDTPSGSFGYIGTGARGSRFDDSLRPWKAYWIATYQDNLALIIPAQ